MKQLLFIIIVFLLIGCTERVVKPHSFGTDRPCPVRIFTIASLDSAEFIESFGTVTFREKTDISCISEGKMKTLFVREGDLVDQGDPIALLENVQLQLKGEQLRADNISSRAALALSEARYREGRLQVEARIHTVEKLTLQADYKLHELETYRQIRENKRELLEADGISREEMREIELRFLSIETEYFSLLKDIETASIGLRDQDIVNSGLAVPSDDVQKRLLLVELNTQTLQAEVGAAEAVLERTLAESETIDDLIQKLFITADKPGVIGAVYFSEGEVVPAGKSIVTLFQAEPVYVMFAIPEEEGQYLRHGQEVAVTIPAVEVSSLHGSIEIISPTIDPQSGTIEVKALVQNREMMLKPGMFANLRIEAGERESTVKIPPEALVTRTESSGTVFIVHQGKAFQRRVIPGVMRDRLMEIREGLKPNENVILSPPPCVEEGRDVHIIE